MVIEVVTDVQPMDLFSLSVQCGKSGCPNTKTTIPQMNIKKEREIQ
jgi:hypothetical protein